eukprot:CAMPEP_0195583324 /NCGR_PEP_ID=MMETSP0814-20130614/23862_1 /TAXON_ID=97485 /ORGANISM="Prymnesium parvum, Strain Texoma1" /LENGTH=55 /DNA_ID=CAMNT_0040721111 /DNA_START=79 /DNA_END=243 /DNA_ORIENTATION=-
MTLVPKRCFKELDANNAENTEDKHQEDNNCAKLRNGRQYAIHQHSHPTNALQRPQ